MGSIALLLGKRLLKVLVLVVISIYACSSIVDKVKIDSLKGKKIGLYFSAAWCGPWQCFTPQLIEIYNELSSKDCFEVVFVSGYEDEESFKDYFSKMP
ncbi:hypothetical protein Bca4012_057425 [Brassica carinata]